MRVEISSPQNIKVTVNRRNIYFIYPMCALLLLFLAVIYNNYQATHTTCSLTVVNKALLKNVINSPKIQSKSISFWVLLFPFIISKWIITIFINKLQEATNWDSMICWPLIVTFLNWIISYLLMFICFANSWVEK